MSVTIDKWVGQIGWFINRITSDFCFYSYHARIFFNNLLPLLSLLLIALFYIFLRKCSLIWITFCVKLRLGTSRRAISSPFYVFILTSYLRWCSSLHPVVYFGNKPVKSTQLQKRSWDHDWFKSELWAPY